MVDDTRIELARRASAELTGELDDAAVIAAEGQPSKRWCSGLVSGGAICQRCCG